MNADKKHPRVKASWYPGARGTTDLDMAESAVWETVHDIMREVNKPRTLEEVRAIPPAPEVMPDFTSLLLAEAARVLGDSHEKAYLLEQAATHIRDAYVLTAVRNPQALARFAVEKAYDLQYRQQISAMLDSTWVRRWRMDPVHHRYACYPGYPEQGMPIPVSELPDLLRNTSQFTFPTLPADNADQPFVGVKPTFGWVMDPVRAPVPAVRAACEIIRREVPMKRFKVLALETGHNVAAEAMAAFLPGSTVDTESFVFPDRTDMELAPAYDAVVMGIPNQAAVEFVRSAINRIYPMSRWECDRFWQWSKTEQPSFLLELIYAGVERVKPSGILVVIGDIESGAHHAADAFIAGTGRFSRILVGEEAGPVVFRYSKQPWGLFGVIPPTNRLLTAWQRME